MQCPQCGAPIAYNAEKCNSCYRETGYTVSTLNFLPPDMYGQNVYELYPNPHKKQMRDNFLSSHPDNFKMMELRQKKQKFYKTRGIKWWHFTPFLLVLPALLVDEPMIPISAFIIGLFITLTLLLVGYYQNRNAPTSTNDVLLKHLEIHCTKVRYWANDNVIGFSTIHRILPKAKAFKEVQYAYYEIDKSLIEDILYDSSYGEYVLILKKAVFMDYEIAPDNRFYIADVFDDHILAQALGKDLPAKNIPF